MTEPRERANLSSVAPIVAPEDEHARVERMFDAWIDKHGPAALARAAGRWLLERSRGFAGKLALLFAGAGAGVGGTAAMNGDTEADAETDVGDDEARLLTAGIREHLAPGGDGDRVTVGLAVGAHVRADLGRRKDEAAGLDGAGTQQHLPVGAAGGVGEGGRQQDRKSVV